MEKDNMKLLLVILVSVLIVNHASYAQDWKSRARDFQEMPTAFRPNPLWFWNNAEVKKDELIQQMQDFRKAGYGGLSILPFGKAFKPEYLTEAYFDAYRACVEEAERLGMKLCIYDEYGFPSGTAGDINGDGIGRFKLKYPELTYKRLDKTEFAVKAGETFVQAIPEQYLMAAVAMDTVNFKRLDLKEYIKQGVLTWNVPIGAWKVMAFHCVDAGNSIVDYLDPEAADLFIQMTHQAYYDRFSDHFGSVVEGTFFDEPTLYYAEGRTWTPAFNEKFAQIHGFDPALLYPALWYDIGDETVEARNYLYGFRAQLFAEGYIKRVNDWSQAHGIFATGHLDNEEIVNSVGTSGDYMKSFKYLEAPGIDKIGGDRPAERFYKLVTSAAYNWDHSLVMSETYGAMGNLSWDEIFGIAMEQYSKGINMLIPHAVWYNTENITFLPELSLRNPIYADSLPAFTDYLTRLNVLLRNDGRWQGDVAVLYPIHTMQGDHYLDGPLGYYKGGVEIPYLDYIDVSVNLLDSLGYDHLFLHPEVLNEKCSVRDGQLHLENEVQHNAFSVVIVPSSKTIDIENLLKLKAFAASGGVVIFTGQLPTQALTAKDNDQATQLVDELIAMEDVHLVASPTVEQLGQLLDRYADRFSLTFAKNPVYNIHKVLDGKHIWFLANPASGSTSTEFELDGQYDLQVWDPHTGVIAETHPMVTVKHANGKTTVSVTLRTCRSIALVQR